MNNKLSNHFCILLLAFIIFSIFPALQVSAQLIPSQREDPAFSRPPVTANWDDYKKQVEKDPAKKMMN